MSVNRPEKIQASEARSRFFELLDRVSRTRKSIVIEKKGEPVAILEDYHSHAKLHAGPPAKEMMATFSRIRRLKEMMRRSRGGPPKTDSVVLLRSLRDEA